MYTEKENLNYIARLCAVAQNKAELGDDAEAKIYYQYAIKRAIYPDAFCEIMYSIYHSELPCHKYFSYFLLYEALERSGKPVPYFLSLYRSDKFGDIIGDFTNNYPGPLFHYIISRIDNHMEKVLISSLFMKFSNFINDPDPMEVMDEYCHAIGICEGISVAL